MTRVELNVHEDLVTVLEKLKNINDTGLEVFVPEGSVLFENILNLKLIKKELEKLGKELHFRTTDESGLNLLSELNEENFRTTHNLPEIDEVYVSPMPEKIVSEKRSITLPKFNFNFKNKKAFLIAFLLLLLFGGIGFALGAPVANVNLKIESQPLTKSISIKIKKDANTDVGQKILKGSSQSVKTTDILKGPTTGEKTVGDLAKGEATIVNKTRSSVTFDEGTILQVSKDGETLEYALTEDVTIAAAEEEPSDTSDTDTPGVLVYKSASVEIEATEIGEKYNISKDTNMRIEDESTNDYSAKARNNLEGGSTEIVKIVTEEDKTKLSAELETKLKDQANKALQAKGVGRTKYISGSAIVAKEQEAFNKQVDEEATELEITQTVNASGLFYNEDELNKILEEITKELVPEGFVISDREKEIKVEVFGNTDKSVLNANEADIQVTLKAYVVPDINEDTLKQDLKGKSLQDAQKILGSLRNVQSYELKVEKSLPFLQRVPSNVEKINLQIDRT